MLEQVWKNLCATKIFFLARFVASIAVGFVYLLIATGVQYTYVSVFGETTFNYIVGGILSLYLGALACTYLGRLMFMFVRGWHMGAVAYAKTIRKRDLPALEVGMTVFRKHFTSYAMVYGASILIKRFADKGSKELWEMLQDVPYLCSLERFASNPVVAKIGNDILDTTFDGVIYYLVKYTKPGLKDDFSAFPDAIKRYIYALPSVLLSSLTLYFCLYFVPKVVRICLMIWLILHNGLVAGILMNVLAYPIFYIIKHSIFEPLETIVLISCYSKHCKEDPIDEGIYKTFVDKVLEAIGFDEFVNADEKATPSEEKPAEESDSKPAEPVSSNVSDEDLVADVFPSFEEDEAVIQKGPQGAKLTDMLNSALYTSASSEAPEDSVSDLPLADEESSKPAQSTGVSLTDVLAAYETGDFGEDEDEEEDEDDDLPRPAPISRLSDMMSKISAASMNEACGVVLRPDEEDDESDGDSNFMGGGSIDEL